MKDTNNGYLSNNTTPATAPGHSILFGIETDTKIMTGQPARIYRNIGTGTGGHRTIKQ